MTFTKNLVNSKIEIITFLFFCFSLNTLAQSGKYVLEPKHSDDVKTKWTLALNPDGTFLYHFFRDIGLSDNRNPEENYYDKGAWEFDGKLIYFFSKPSDLSEEFSVNLNNSKARYITKSPRDRSGRVVKESLRFYDSETFHISGLTLVKE